MITEKSHRVWWADPRLHFVLLVLVAGAFRLWRLDAIPPGLFGDEATDGLDAMDVLAGHGAVFFPANFGREGLHMWIVAAFFRLLGVTPLALRLPSALAGIGTVLATYWLGRELLRNGLSGKPEGRAAGAWEWVPLLAAMFTATSFWHVHFSRFGIRGVFTPLCGALAFAALWRGINQARAVQRGLPWFAAAGFFLGLATHFYTASRFFPFFLIGFLAVEWLIARRSEATILRSHGRGLALIAAVAVLVFLPLGIYFLQHPGSFTARAGEVAAVTQGNPLREMGRAAVANVLQFVLPGKGDPAQFYNLPGRAVFDPISAALAVIGLAVLVARMRRPGALFLLLWIPALLLPSFLATDRYPTLPRVLGVIPAIYFLPAAGLASVVNGVRSLLKRRIAPVVLALVALASVLVQGGLAWRDYFDVWGRSAATFDAFEGDMTAAWRWLENNPAPGHVYVSSDIYRHPTYALLAERASVRTIFTYQSPTRSLFDARSALPLPAPGEETAYLLAAGALPPESPAGWLSSVGEVKERVPAPEGRTALSVFRLPGDAALPVVSGLGTPVAFTDRLTLTGAAVRAAPGGGQELWLRWHTAGPDMAAWPGYRLQIAARDWVGDQQFDSFRGTEWVPGGSFLTWHPLDVTLDASPRISVRLIRLPEGVPVQAAGASDGWHEIVVPG